MYYRFRSIKKLLEYKELEREEIFFASPLDLNDPMEGFKDIVWQGDSITWKNLFKHYLLCLNQSLLLFSLGVENICEVPKFFQKQILSCLNTEIIDNFFYNKVVKQIIDYLLYLQKPIRRNELISYLKIIHPIALKSVVEAMKIDDIFKTDDYIKQMNYSKLTKAIDEQKKLKLNGNQKEELFEKLIKFYDTFSIINDECIDNKRNLKDILFLKNNFMINYVNKIESFIVPNWYTACFMSKCDNSSLWGYYGDNHKGACLIFDLDEDSIKIKQKSGFMVLQGKCVDEYSWVDMEFLKVDYEKEIVTIDFFKSLIKIVQLKEIYQKQWFYDEKENVSSIYKIYMDNKDVWKKSYLKIWDSIVVRKDIVWQFENEYRLILNDLWDEYDTNGVALKYDFSKLKGIIFGIKTANQDKYKILKILKAKGKNENNFSFYQAYYDANTGGIEKFRIPLFEFEEFIIKLKTKKE